MGSVRRFEDLVAWQKARVLAQDIYAVTRRGALSRDLGLTSQMQRAAVSILSNIAEGFERSGSGEFHQFLATAKGSCAELRAQLYIAHDVGYLNPADFRRLLLAAEEVGRIVGALRASIERRRNDRAASIRGSSHRASLSTQHSQNVAPGPTVRALASPKSMQEANR